MVARIGKRSLDVLNPRRAAYARRAKLDAEVERLDGRRVLI
jgi:hypothetical protein